MPDDLQWSELIDPAEFSAAWRKLQSREAFELRLGDNVTVSGYSPADYELDRLYYAIHPASVAHSTLKIAINDGTVDYALFVNDILVMFNWPMGWSFLPENSYQAGGVPVGWKNMRALGTETLNQLIEQKDTDTSHG